MTINLRLILLATALLTGMTVGCQRFKPVASQCPGKIVYSVPGEDSHHRYSYTLYSIDPDGDNLQRLTHSPTQDITPVISPAGDRLSFVSRSDTESALYVMNIDGTSKVNVISSEDDLSFPLWSIAEDTFLFLHRGGSVLRELRTVSLETPESIKTIPLDFPDATLVQDLSRSPDGNSVTFGSLTPWRGGSQIYRVDLASRKVRQLTKLYRAASDPNWSPDGRKIVFVGTQIDPVVEGGMSEIYIMNADGSRQQTLEIELMGQKSQPVWSPDGQKIAFINNSETIYSIDVDGGNLTKLMTFEKSAAQFTLLGYESDLSWQSITCNATSKS